MSLYETIAFSLIGTPLQNPAEGLRWVKGLPQRWKHPELRELYRESKRAKALLERTITPGMNCIDIGCHIGSVLHEIIRLSPGGRHIAVEPLPYKVERLRRRYPRVDIQQVALGEENSTIEFYYNPRNSGFSGLRGDGQGDSTTLRVECKRLDDIVPPGLRIGFIKLDVEGGEYAVFLAHEGCSRRAGRSSCSSAPGPGWRPSGSVPPRSSPSWWMNKDIGSTCSRTGSRGDRPSTCRGSKDR